MMIGFSFNETSNSNCWWSPTESTGQGHLLSCSDQSGENIWKENKLVAWLKNGDSYMSSYNGIRKIDYMLMNGLTQISHGPCFEGLSVWQWTDSLTSKCGLAQILTPILRPTKREKVKSKNSNLDCSNCYGLRIVFDTMQTPSFSQLN